MCPKLQLYHRHNAKTGDLGTGWPTKGHSPLNEPRRGPAFETRHMWVRLFAQGALRPGTWAFQAFNSFSENGSLDFCPDRGGGAVNERAGMTCQAHLQWNGKEDIPTAQLITDLTEPHPTYSQLPADQLSSLPVPHTSKAVKDSLMKIFQEIAGNRVF